jgi:radical SAM superfamily enzyme YgiQ (UPF0313 family)
MRILLVHPPPLEKAELTSGMKYHPVGLTYIAAVLRKDGHEVSIFDGNVLRASIRDVTDLVKKYSPDIVGITATSADIHNAFMVADAIKGATEIKVIAGGVHPTAAPHHTLSNPNIDAIVVGEGEVTICELIRAIEDGGVSTKLKE